MKPRDRVRMALNHEEPDRCPMQISFTPEFAERLREDMGLKDASEHNPHGGGNTYALERALGEDLLLTSVGWANSYYGGGDEYTDEWGVGWKSVKYATKFGPGRYTEIVHHPLADSRAIAAYRPPDPERPELYAESLRTIQDFKDEYWIVGVTVTTIFETAIALRGLEQLVSDFILDPDRAEAVLDLPFQFHLTAAKKLTEAGVDSIWIGDDIGAQHAMMISPAHWRKFLKPRLAEFISSLKAINPAVKVAYHSDGFIDPVIPELVEVGVDILNPIQPACLDPAKVKRGFGDKLCFWGSIDEQYTLPFGTPEGVRQEVLNRIGTIGQGGGLILSPSHHVQLDTPLENFWAMVNTVKETRYASLRS
jgi:uroporphyrinogen decarboxylase